MIGRIRTVEEGGCTPNSKNHGFQIRLFDPENENQREDFYYSLILLFTPLREESSLLLENETAEEAFHRLVCSDSSAYHAKLKRMLEAQSNIKQINEARFASGPEERVNKNDDPQLMGEAKTAMNDEHQFMQSAQSRRKSSDAECRSETYL